MCTRETESEVAAPLVLWCSAGRAPGGVLGKGGRGERGGLGTLPEAAVLTWALPGGVNSGGVNNAAVLPKGHFLQTPLEALLVTTHPPHTHTHLSTGKRGLRQLLKVENGRARMQTEVGPGPNPLFPPPPLN